MGNQSKTKEQLLGEIQNLRKKIAKLQESKAERKRAEQMLHHQANMLKNVSDAIIFTTLDFKIRSWNKAAEMMYGWNSYETNDKAIDKIKNNESIDSQPFTGDEILSNIYMSLVRDEITRSTFELSKG